MFAVISIVAGGLVWRTASGTEPLRVLVAGDSVIVQSAAALRAFAPPGVSVDVAGGIGSAPCDWVHGYVDPYTHTYRRFSIELDRFRPRYVVLMFAGNPGLSGPRAGCVDASRPYSEANLTASYRSALRILAKEATAEKATVIFEQPPPRNPAVPAGVDRPTGTDTGYQGSPFIGVLMHQIVNTAPFGAAWIYADTAADYVSGPNLAYATWLPCDNLIVHRCVDGRVQIRAGGGDAVHLDPAGCGAIFFATGIEDQFVSALRLRSYLLQDRRSYDGCR